MQFEWGTSRRFNAYADYFRKQFGERVQKLSVNAGFTCPNRDGTKGRGGCTFCNNKAFSPSYNDPQKSVTQQIREGITFHRERYRRVTRYLAYFQAYSNTYAPVSRLRQVYEEALQHPDVIGLVIGTRPDCADDDILEYIAELSESVYVVVEYGIESVNDITLKAINRGHDFNTTRDAIQRTAAKGIRVGGHLIMGLPGEDESDWLRIPEILSELPLHSVKFHQLQLIRETQMAGEFSEDPGRFPAFEIDAYLDLMARITERLRPDLVIERIAGEVNPGTALREGWGIRYDQVLQRFEKLLEEHDTWQGKLYTKNQS